MPTPSEADFHRTIAAGTPHPEIPRPYSQKDGVTGLVYADWLQEQGRHGTADVVRQHAERTGDSGSVGGNLLHDDPTRPGWHAAIYTHVKSGMGVGHGIRLTAIKVGGGTHLISWWSNHTDFENTLAHLAQLRNEGVILDEDAHRSLALHEQNEGQEPSDDPGFDPQRYKRTALARAWSVGKKVKAKLARRRHSKARRFSHTLGEGRRTRGFDGEPVIHHAINGPDGKPVGTLSVHDRGEELHVNWVGLNAWHDPATSAADVANRLGAGAVRDLHGQLSTLYPKAQFITGRRITGTRSGQHGIDQRVRVKIRRRMRRRFNRQDLAALLSHLRSNPDDAVARGAYSDWLEEHGHVAAAFAARLAVDAPAAPGTWTWRHPTGVDPPTRRGRRGSGDFLANFPGHQGAENFVVQILPHQESTVENPRFVVGFGATAADPSRDDGMASTGDMHPTFGYADLSQMHQLADHLRAAGTAPQSRSDLRYRAKPDLHKWLAHFGYPKAPRGRRRFSRRDKAGFHAAMTADGTKPNKVAALAYSDWLEEQGFPQVAAHVRQSIANGWFGWGSAPQFSPRITYTPTHDLPRSRQLVAFSEPHQGGKGGGLYFYGYYPSQYHAQRVRDAIVDEAIVPPQGQRRFARPTPNQPQGFVQALRQLRSRQQTKLRGVADEIAKSLSLAPAHTRDALHDTPEVAVPSIAQAVYRSPDPETVKYAAAWYGLISQTPSLVAFHVRRFGPDSVYKWHMPGSGEDIRAKLDRAGIHSRVLMPKGDGFDVLYFDQGRRLRPRVKEFAKLHGITAEESLGKGDLLGGATKEEARAKYRKIVERYEGTGAGPVRQSRRGKPRRFSAQDHASFHQAIAANPTDPTPSLVYADMLEEEGKPAHAEYIRRHAGEMRDDQHRGHNVEVGNNFAQPWGWTYSTGGFNHRYTGMDLAVTISPEQELRWNFRNAPTDWLRGLLPRLAAEGAVPYGNDATEHSRQPEQMSRRGRPRRFAKELDVEAFHKAMLEDQEQKGIAPLVYADWLEEMGRPAIAAVIRRHAEVYPWGHTHLRGSPGGMRTNYQRELPTGSWAAQAMHTPNGLTYDHPGVLPGREKFPDGHDLIQVEHVGPETAPVHKRVFAWEIPVQRDKIPEVLARLKAEGCHLPPTQEQTPSREQGPVQLRRQHRLRRKAAVARVFAARSNSR